MALEARGSLALMSIVLVTRKLSSVLLLAALGTACQAAPPPQCPTPPVVTPPPETPENHEAAVRRLFELMQMPRLMEATVDTLLAAQLRTNPTLVPYAETMREFLQEHMSWDALEDDFVKIYVAGFTQREVEDLVAFYETPTGKKSVEKMPDLIEQGAEVGRARMRDNMNELLQKIQSRTEELEQGPPTDG